MFSFIIQNISVTGILKNAEVFIGFVDWENKKNLLFSRTRASHGIRTHDLLITNELLYQLS